MKTRYSHTVVVVFVLTLAMTALSLPSRPIVAAPPSPEMQDDTGADLEEQTSDDPLHVTLFCPAENKEYDLCYRSVANDHYGWSDGGSPSTMESVA